ncbi:putative metal-binding hydrolase [uncultured Alphaproteobacteria bacterium]|uniref:Putative metal-binding hydrolase n=1 Tax=uncultured Alphaproteobacteria bacterium TaxID=91750 RepID=A0A212IX74_9PROT|nr:putative metal-binding hydrolase [uncultured Alphaproteobacteria bacterium]
MKAMIVPVTAFAQNCTILWCEETLEAAVVDPGGDLAEIEAAVARKELKVVKILLTHGHVDHIAGTANLKAKLGVPVEGPHEADAYLLEALPDSARGYGFPPAASFTPDRWLKGGDTVCFGNVVLEVLHCPGHTPGSVVFFHRQEKVALVGDVLFQGSIGRTDLPGGNAKDLIASVREKLFKLGDEVVFIPGHGPLSSIGDERKSNPYVGDGAGF